MTISISRRNKIHKRMSFRNKLRTLGDLVNSHSEESSEIIMDAFLYISALKLKLEALKKERTMNHAHRLPLLKVNVEKIEKVRIRLVILVENAMDNYMVPILEAFEEMGMNVVNARVSCTTHFAMEAIVEGQEIDDSTVLSQAILKAIRTSSNVVC